MLKLQGKHTENRLKNAKKSDGVYSTKFKLSISQLHNAVLDCSLDLMLFAQRNGLCFTQEAIL